MSSDEVLAVKDGDDVLPLPSTPTTLLEYSRSVSQDLRNLDDALTHAIDQLNIFNSETMSDLSLKYEHMRNNESRVIGFFARQLILVQMQKTNGQNGGFHSEYSKLDRFLSVINFNKKSIDYIVQRVTFDDLLYGKAATREKLLYDAGTTETERKDFRNALNALKDCIDYFTHGGTNDDGRFYWHTETPSSAATNPHSVRQHRLSDTVLSVPSSNTDTVRSTSVSSSISTEFGTIANSHNQIAASSSPHTRRKTGTTTHTPPPSRSNHLCVNGKGKCEHPSKKSSVDPAIFSGNNTTNPPRNFDLQLPSGSRRSSYGSDNESRLASESEQSLENETKSSIRSLFQRKITIVSFQNYRYNTALSSPTSQQTPSQLHQKNFSSSPQLTTDQHTDSNDKMSSSSTTTPTTKKRLWNRCHPKEGSATPKSPTIRSPTMSGSPAGSAQNSDAEGDTRIPDIPTHSTHSPILRHRMAHKIQHKWSNLMKLSTCNVCTRKIFFLGTKCNVCKFDRTRVFKFSFCDVCRRQVFRGKACLHCKYKCHRECVQNAPPNCGLSEGKLRRVLDDTNIQNAFANSSPYTRKHHFIPSDSTSPTSSTPMSAPGSPAPHPIIPYYPFNPTSSTPTGNPPICVSESIYCTQNDPDSWVVIETSKIVPEIPESQSDSDTNSTIPTETNTTNLTDSTMTNNSKLLREASQNESVHHRNREDLLKSKLFINSFDDEEADPEQRSINLATSLQDWVIVFNNIKMIEEVRRSSGTLMKAHWHGEIAVRIIKPNSKMSEVEFLNKFKNQVFRLRKVRHEHLNLYTGVCIESPNIAIASNWIRGSTLFEMIHIRNDLIPFNLAVQYAAQIAQAMSYLHEKAINHMSLRTTNIFVQNNRIVLTDYGLVPLSKCYRTRSDSVMVAPRGWLSYLAPEILRKLDPRDENSLLQHSTQTDVYAFGTVWYELLFREFPFAKQPPEYIIWRAGNSLKQPLSSVHISKNAKDIIHQCWSFVPDDRPDFAMLCKSLTKMPGKRALVRSPSTPLQYHTRPSIEPPF